MRKAFVGLCYGFAILCVVLAVWMPFAGGAWYHSAQSLLSAITAFLSGKLVASLPTGGPR